MAAADGRDAAARAHWRRARAAVELERRALRIMEAFKAEAGGWGEGGGSDVDMIGLQ